MRRRIRAHQCHRSARDVSSSWLSLQPRPFERVAVRALRPAAQQSAGSRKQGSKRRSALAIRPRFSHGFSNTWKFVFVCPLDYREKSHFRYGTHTDNNLHTTRRFTVPIEAVESVRGCGTLRAAVQYVFIVDGTIPRDPPLVPWVAFPRHGPVYAGASPGRARERAEEHTRYSSHRASPTNSGQHEKSEGRGEARQRSGGRAADV